MNGSDDNQRFDAAQPIDYECPACGHAEVSTREVARSFKYGAGDQAIDLTTHVPLRVCGNCAAQFFDDEADRREHDAVCRHLGRLTPREIRRIRGCDGGCSRAAFAELSKLGEATIGRWERGELLQNAANDQYIYLLAFEDNIERLRGRQARRETATVVVNVALQEKFADLEDFERASRESAFFDPLGAS